MTFALLDAPQTTRDPRGVRAADRPKVALFDPRGFRKSGEPERSEATEPAFGRPDDEDELWPWVPLPGGGLEFRG